MKTPSDKRITFTFYSPPVPETAWRWKATLTFEPGSTDDSLAVVEACDGNGDPIAEGVFEVAGRRIPVANGRGAVRCGDFVAGKDVAGVWFCRPGMKPLHGGLTFE